MVMPSILLKNESDVFDLAVLKILIPEGYSGSYMQMVLDDEKCAEVFTKGSFDIFRYEKLRPQMNFSKKLESKSTLNFGIHFSSARKSDCPLKRISLIDLSLNSISRPSRTPSG